MTAKPPIVNDRFWDRLRYHGTPVKDHLLRDLPDNAPQSFRDSAWRSFKQHCAAQGNILPLLIYQTEPQDSGQGMFRRRARRPRESDPFEELPPLQRAKAVEKFSELCQKWSGNLPSWRRAILAGVARRLALHPPDSEWGRRMRRIKGGVHCQRKYPSRAGIRSQCSGGLSADWKLKSG